MYSVITNSHLFRALWCLLWSATLWTRSNYMSLALLFNGCHSHLFSNRLLAWPLIQWNNYIFAVILDLGFWRTPIAHLIWARPCFLMGVIQWNNYILPPFWIYVFGEPHCTFSCNMVKYGYREQFFKAIRQNQHII